MMFSQSNDLLRSRIRSRAVELGYDPARIEPIYDGVADWGAYLAAPRKICWVLKEPYDETGNAQKQRPARAGEVAEGRVRVRDRRESPALAEIAEHRYCDSIQPQQQVYGCWRSEFP